MRERTITINGIVSQAGNLVKEGAGTLSLGSPSGNTFSADDSNPLVERQREDNRAVLARQATERLPVSRTYLPTLFVNIVGRRQA